eukprot:CAMPEP_0194419230 /NCGR_PEP_ID=MMETSP0176-20130528/18458_1 /TAXON_ID=216777 /ORGANISM="Proboscia alata, Strain PI-D3" /LENGTH=453 /DNA_ID=CAMNT_0039226149 /DNA_START=60 /DNA_END=1421 /DNA_ORIENTATION=+
MAKKNKKGTRRKGSSDSDSEHDNVQPDAESSGPSLDDMDFAERREFQRKAAAEKRRTKMKCHVCGQAGHTRRECPGINDDGRGHSKFTKSNGDAGATVLKAKAAKSKDRGHKPEKNETTTQELPHGFNISSSNGSKDDGPVEDPFSYIDACCDGNETLEYLRFGRGKNKLSKKEAISEFDITMDEVSTTSNFGSCISRFCLKKGMPWDTSKAYPFALENVKFVIGLDKAFDGSEDDTNLLVKMTNAHENIIGMFCNLDYSLNNKQSHESQLQLLRCTCNAASQSGCPIQIRTSPSPSAMSEGKDDNDPDEISPYSTVMIDLAKILLEVTELCPDLKIHLSCWNGKVEHMNALLLTFPENIWIGFDATVSFTKAKVVHECAFEIPLEKVLLESGKATTIHSKFTKAKGREAFCHPGLIPFIAESLAEKKSSALGITPEQLARSAAVNTVLLYNI